MGGSSSRRWCGNGCEAYYPLHVNQRTLPTPHERATCMTNARVSVIICCYTLNRLKGVRDTVHSVLVQNLSPGEVIVSVDHNPQLLEILAAEMPPSGRLVC